MAWHPIFGQAVHTYLAHLRHVAMLGQQHYGLAKFSVGALGYHKRMAQEGPQRLLHFLYLYFYSPRIYHIILSSENPELRQRPPVGPIGGAQFGTVVGHEGTVAHLGSRDNKTRSEERRVGKECR